MVTIQRPQKQVHPPPRPPSAPPPGGHTRCFLIYVDPSQTRTQARYKVSNLMIRFKKIFQE